MIRERYVLLLMLIVTPFVIALDGCDMRHQRQMVPVKTVDGGQVVLDCPVIDKNSPWIQMHLGYCTIVEDRCRDPKPGEMHLAECKK